MQDVFSAGCVLAEMFLDGKLLFDRPQVLPQAVTCIPHSNFQIEQYKQEVKSAQTAHQGCWQVLCHLQSLHCLVMHIGSNSNNFDAGSLPTNAPALYQRQ